MVVQDVYAVMVGPIELTIKEQPLGKICGRALDERQGEKLQDMDEDKAVRQVPPIFCKEPPHFGNTKDYNMLQITIVLVHPSKVYGKQEMSK